jgi:hypothetical protein
VAQERLVNESLQQELCGQHTNNYDISSPLRLTNRVVLEFVQDIRCIQAKSETRHRRSLGKLPLAQASAMAEAGDHNSLEDVGGFAEGAGTVISKHQRLSEC